MWNRFWIMRSGQMFSIIGDFFGFMAISWAILDKAPNSPLIFWIWLPAFLIQALLSVPYAAWAENRNNVSALIVADIARTLSWTGILLLFIWQATGLPLTLFLAVNAFFSTVYNVSENNVFRLITNDNIIAKAQRLSQVVLNAARLLGTIAGALGVDVFGINACISINIASFFVSTLLNIVLQRLTTCEPFKEAPASLKSISADIRASLGYIREKHEVRWIFTASLLLSTFTTPLQLFVVNHVKNTLHVPATFVGIFEAILFGTMMLAPMVYGKLVRTEATSVLTPMMVLGVAVSVPFLIPGFTGLVLCGLLYGTSMVIIQINLQTFLFKVIDRAFFSRVFTVLMLGEAFGGPLGMGLGALIMKIVPLMAFIITGACLLLVIIVFKLVNQRAFVVALGD